MPLNKPTIGQTGWGTVLNNALDYLDAKESSSADIADFEFEVVDDGDGEFSRATVANHDMQLRTIRDNVPEGQPRIDADIDINSADDVWIYANGDDIHLYAADDVEITTNFNNGTSYNWEFNNSGGLKFPNGTIQTTAYTGGAQTYTANNEARYGTYQASGFIEVTPAPSATLNGDIYTLGGASNVDFVNFSIGAAQHNILNGDSYIRRITINDESGTVRFLRNPGYVGTTEGGYEWSFECDLTLSLLDATTYTLSIEYGGAPVIWWDADEYNNTNEEFVNSNFRGAKIEYHAHVRDAGTVIGTIYIASDSGDNNVTHIETSSGGNDTGTAIFWDRSGNERELYLYRTDGEAELHKIQWTAQMYYSTEFYDD